jgi:hypothetical protein
LPTRKAIDVSPVDVSTLTESDMRAHYKKTAPVDDVRFLLAHGGQALDATLRGELETLAVSGVARAEFYRRYGILQDRWRQAANTNERIETAATRDAIDNAA